MVKQHNIWNIAIMLCVAIGISVDLRDRGETQAQQSEISHKSVGRLVTLRANEVKRKKQVVQYLIFGAILLYSFCNCKKLKTSKVIKQRSKKDSEPIFPMDSTASDIYLEEEEEEKVIWQDKVTVPISSPNIKEEKSEQKSPESSLRRQNESKKVTTPHPNPKKARRVEKKELSYEEIRLQRYDFLFGHILSHSLRVSTPTQPWVKDLDPIIKKYAGLDHHTNDNWIQKTYRLRRNRIEANRKWEQEREKLPEYKEYMKECDNYIKAKESMPSKYKYSRKEVKKMPEYQKMREASKKYSQATEEMRIS